LPALLVGSALHSTKGPERKQFSIVLLRGPNRALNLFCKLLELLGCNILLIDFLNELRAAPISTSFVNFVIAIATVEKGFGSDASRFRRYSQGGAAALESPSRDQANH
jgi:hypothetical protein